MNIAFVEDSPQIHERIRQMLQTGFPTAVLTSFASLLDAMPFAMENRQDCWLVDLGLPDGTGVDLICCIRRHHPDTSILVLTVFGDTQSILKSIQAGANGYLLKQDLQSEDALSSVIQSIMDGGMPLSPLAASRLLGAMNIVSSQAESMVSKDKLTPRETELLQLIARGYSYQEAATLMCVGLSTVQTLIKRIYTKLAVNSRTEAVFEARMLGILK